MARLRVLAAGAAVAAVTLSTACADAIIGPEVATDRASLFDDLWREVDLHYSFLEYKGLNWKAIGDQYRPAALAAASDAAFADVLGAMLAELKDVHVSITPFGAASTLRYISPIEKSPQTFDPSRVIPRYVSDARTTSGGHIRFGSAAPDVGYIHIPSFIGTGWASEIDEALAALPNARSLIVDVRNNPGGSRPLALDVAGRFTDRSQSYGYLRFRNGPDHGDFTDYLRQTVSPGGPKQFLGPVLLLTNRRSFSSAEDLTLAMRALPNVTVVGDTTGGAAGGPMVRELANGWSYQFSEWIEYTADKKPFEGIGLAPDVFVASPTAAPSTPSAATNGSDATIDRALGIARGQR